MALSRQTRMLTFKPVPGVGAEVGSGGDCGGWFAGAVVVAGLALSGVAGSIAECVGGAEEAGGEETAATLMRVPPGNLSRVQCHTIVRAGLSVSVKFYRCAGRHDIGASRRLYRRLFRFVFFAAAFFVPAFFFAAVLGRAGLRSGLPKIAFQLSR